MGVQGHTERRGVADRETPGDWLNLVGFSDTVSGAGSHVHRRTPHLIPCHLLPYLIPCHLLRASAAARKPLACLGKDLWSRVCA